MFPRPEIGLTWQAARTAVAGGQLLTLLVNSPQMIQALPPDETTCSTHHRFLLHCVLGEGAFTWPTHLLLTLLFGSVVSGLLPRLTGPLHVYSALTMHAVLSTRDGGDQAALVLSVLMLPICLADDRLQAWSGVRSFGQWSSVAVLAIRLQIASIYGEAAIAKLAAPTWTEGTAVAYWTQGIYFRPMDSFAPLVTSVAVTPMGTLLASYGTIAFELSLAASLLLRPSVRRLLLPMAVAFHVLIGLTFGIWSFVLVMIGAALLLLAVPEVGLRSASEDERSRGVMV